MGCVFYLSSLSYITATYVIEAMAAANAWSLSDETEKETKKKRSVQENHQITNHNQTVSEPVS